MCAVPGSARESRARAYLETGLNLHRPVHGRQHLPRPIGHFSVARRKRSQYRLRPRTARSLRRRVGGAPASREGRDAFRTTMDRCRAGALRRTGGNRARDDHHGEFNGRQPRRRRQLHAPRGHHRREHRHRRRRRPRSVRRKDVTYVSTVSRSVDRRSLSAGLGPRRSPAHRSHAPTSICTLRSRSASLDCR